MAKGLITHAYLEDTADAIRVLRGESNTYTPDEFGEKIIDAIPTEEVTDSIVSVTDAAAYPAEGLEFAIEPVQDLHGYDKPWPAGGGKNLLPTFDTTPTVKGLTITVNNGAITINGTISETTTIKAPIGDWKWDGTEDCWLSGCPVGGSATRGYSLRVADVEISSGFSKYDTGSGIRLEEYGGASTTIINRPLCFEIVLRSGTYTNKTFLPMLNYGLSAEPYEPYANICPISGWTAVNGERTGKNLYKQALDEYYLDTVTGLPVESSGYEVSEYIPVRENAPVYIPASGTARRWLYDVYKTPKVYLNNSSNQVYTPTENGYIRVSLAKTASTYATYQIEYGTAPTTYEPYQGTSIPITFPALGKNLCDSSKLVNGTYNASGVFVPTSTYVVTPKIAINGGESYVWTSHISFVFAYATFWDSEDNVISQSRITSGTTAAAQAPSNARYVAFSANYATQTDVEAIKPTQVEKGSIATAYEPYTNTVYGGKADVVNGKLTVDRAMVDLGSPTWGYTNGRFFYNPTNAKVYTLQEIANLLCSQYPPTRYGSQADNTISSYAGYIYVRADSYSGDTSAFKTAMNGVQLVYELATAIEYDITPQQVQMLLGDNNIWCDTGDTTLEYKVDLGRYIAKLQAAQAPQLSLSRQAVSLDAAGDDTIQNEDEAGDLR